MFASCFPSSASGVFLGFGRSEPDAYFAPLRAMRG